MKYSAQKNQGGNTMAEDYYSSKIPFRDLEWGAAFTDDDAFYFDPDLPEEKKFPQYPQRKRVYIRIGLTNEAVYLPHGTIKSYPDDKPVYPVEY